MPYVEPLSDRAIAISVSESPDMAALGLGEQHLRDALVETARHLLALGARLLYGGDLRTFGFTELLFELVARHRRDVEQDDRRAAVTNYLPWPVHVALTEKELATRITDLHQTAALVCLGRDGDVIASNRRAQLTVKQPTSADWSRGLTAMRRVVTDECDARILLGGRISDYKGKMPGIAEEALISLKTRKPTFLLGGFGGCTHDIARTLGLTEQHSELDTIAWRGRKRFAGYKFFDLNNGLNNDENVALARTVHVDEAVALVLRGLFRLNSSTI